MAKSNRTHEYPPQIENLGDGTFYYNFNVVETQTEEGYPNYDYDQVRCRYRDGSQEPNIDDIKHCLTLEGYTDHEVQLQNEEFQ